MELWFGIREHQAQYLIATVYKFILGSQIYHTRLYISCSDLAHLEKLGRYPLAYLEVGTSKSGVLDCDKNCRLHLFRLFLNYDVKIKSLIESLKLLVVEKAISLDMLPVCMCIILAILSVLCIRCFHYSYYIIHY